MIEKDRQRVIGRILKSSNEDECWYWGGYITKYGYGAITIQGKTNTAHRAVYEALVGEIPEGMQIDHLCHNLDETCDGGWECKHRSCVNVKHLEAVTTRVNLRRSPTASTINAIKTHCLRGHKFTPGNTRISISNGLTVRFCKKCDKIRANKAVERRQTLMKQGSVIPTVGNLPKTRCNKGHEYTEESVYFDKRGYAQCRLCQKERDTARRARLREEKEARGEVVRLGPKPKTHCKQGHPYDEANTYISKSDNRRHCRQCLALQAVRQRAKKKTGLDLAA